MEQLGDLPPEMRDALSGLGGPPGPGSVVLGIIMAPILALVVLFIWSAIVHLVLNLIGGLKESTAGFEGTLRALSFSTVVQLATIVPFVGPFIAMIWGIVLQVLGLSSLHRTSQGKALAGVLIPIAVCCVCIIVVAVAFGAALAAAIAGAAGN
jgi:hypothetical protein